MRTREDEIMRMLDPAQHVEWMSWPAGAEGRAVLAGVISRERSSAPHNRAKRAVWGRWLIAGVAVTAVLLLFFALLPSSWLARRQEPGAVSITTASGMDGASTVTMAVATVRDGVMSAFDLSVLLIGVGLAAPGEVAADTSALPSLEEALVQVRDKRTEIVSRRLKAGSAEETRVQALRILGTLETALAEGTVCLYLAENATPDDIEILMRQIAKQPEVEAAVFVSKQDALEFALAERGPEIADALVANPFPHTIQIKARNPEEAAAIAEKLTQNPAVETVAFGQVLLGISLEAVSRYVGE